MSTSSDSLKVEMVVIVISKRLMTHSLFLFVEWTSYKSGVKQQKSTLQQGRQEKAVALQAPACDD